MGGVSLAMLLMCPCIEIARITSFAEVDGRGSGQVDAYLLKVLTQQDAIALIDTCSRVDSGSSLPYHA